MILEYIYAGTVAIQFISFAFWRRGYSNSYSFRSQPDTYMFTMLIIAFVPVLNLFSAAANIYSHYNPGE